MNQNNVSSRESASARGIIAALAVVLLLYFGGYGVFFGGYRVFTSFHHPEVTYLYRGHEEFFIVPNRPAYHVIAKLYEPLLYVRHQHVDFL